MVTQPKDTADAINRTTILGTSTLRNLKSFYLSNPEEPDDEPHIKLKLLTRRIHQRKPFVDTISDAVGDTPLISAGTYANLCDVSTTGKGEEIKACLGPKQMAYAVDQSEPIVTYSRSVPLEMITLGLEIWHNN
ncbi:hypothetical protein YC2023_014729 [Brassica napus]